MKVESGSLEKSSSLWSAFMIVHTSSRVKVSIVKTRKK